MEDNERERKAAGKLQIPAHTNAAGCHVSMQADRSWARSDWLIFTAIITERREKVAI